LDAGEGSVAEKKMAPAMRGTGVRGMPARKSLAGMGTIFVSTSEEGKRGVRWGKGEGK